MGTRMRSGKRTGTGMGTEMSHSIPLPVSNHLLLVLAKVFQPVPRDVEAQHLPVLEQLGAAEDTTVRGLLR